MSNVTARKPYVIKNIYDAESVTDSFEGGEEEATETLDQICGLAVRLGFELKGVLSETNRHAYTKMFREVADRFEDK